MGQSKLAIKPKKKQKPPMTRAQARKAKKAAEPFLLTESDPANFWGDDKPKLKETNRGKPRKVLTIRKKRRIIDLVKKLKRKDDKMATDETKNTKGNKRNALLSVAWLVEAAFRAFVGWVLLSNFDHIVTTAAAFYALGTAGVIVVTHFVNAHK